MSILVIDDRNWPDGTGRIADELRDSLPHFHVIHREGKLGLGTATLAAIGYAIDHRFDYLLNLDADFSHPPRFIPALLAGMANHDVMIGSRPMFRAVGSRAGSRSAPIDERRDQHLRPAAAGPQEQGQQRHFRCYRVSKLAEIDLSRIRSRLFVSGRDSLLVPAGRLQDRRNADPVRKPAHGSSKINMRREAVSARTWILLCLGLSRAGWVERRRPLQSEICPGLTNVGKPGMKVHSERKNASYRSATRARSQRLGLRQRQSSMFGLKFWIVPKPLDNGHPRCDLLRCRHHTAGRRAPFGDREHKPGVAQSLGQSTPVAGQHRNPIGHRLDRHPPQRLAPERRHQYDAADPVEIARIGVLAIRFRFVRPDRSTGNPASPSALPRPSTINNGISGRRRPSSRAIRAKTAAPFSGCGLMNVAYPGWRRVRPLSVVSCERIRRDYSRILTTAAQSAHLATDN